MRAGAEGGIVMKQDEHGRQPTDPTPRQIARACEGIRRGWSEDTRRKRMAWALQRGEWRVQVVSASAATAGQEVGSQDAA